MKDRFAQIEDHLRGMVEGPYLTAALAQIGPDGTERAVLMGRAAADGPALTDPSLRMRVASVTKLATGHAIAALAAQGVLDLDAPVDLDSPGTVSLGALLSHTSGITDEGGYVAGPGAGLSDLVTGAFWREKGFFRYSNLGILCAAAAVERQTGLRFDHLLSAQVFQLAGIGGGVNWVDVDAAGRKHRLPLSQRRGEALHLAVDAAVDPRAEMVWADGTGHSLMGYLLGEDTGLLSPHGGLRCSVVEMARLARLVGSDRPAARLQRKLRWRFDGTNGADCGGLFQAYGLGVTLYDGHPQIPGPLVGHGAAALGFLGGAWFNRETGVAWAYALNGAPEPPDDGEDEGFYSDDELRILTLF